MTVPMQPYGMEWAVQVTTRDGRTSMRHEDDPFIHRQSADQYATQACLAPQVASAVVVGRQVWHGPWTTNPAEETP